MAADAIGLVDLANGTARRGVVIASESALFIALQTAEALRESPSRVAIESIRLTSDGTVEVVTARGTRDEAGAAATVATVCETLLRPPPGSVRGLIDRVRNGQVGKVDALCAELEALLVPLNRAAARRVLGRFVRDHHRAAENSPAETPPVATAPRPAESSEAKPAPASVPKPSVAKPETPSALDTAPDAKSPLIEPLPGAARPGQSAVDTEPDAAAGITAMLAHPIGVQAASDEGRVSHDSLENPRIPPPPPLGSLGDLDPNGRGGSVDREPEAYPNDASKSSSVDTVIEGGIAKSRAKPADEDDDDLDRLPIRRSGSSVVLAIAIGSLLVALLVLAFALTKR